MKTQIIIKNMVCDRCIKVVSNLFKSHNINFSKVELGKIFFEKPISSELEIQINAFLMPEGFEIVWDAESKIINEIKTLIISSIFHTSIKIENQNYSSFLASTLGLEYTHLSRLFSEKEGKTIEKYIIQQKIERVKELIDYNELSLSQISYTLNYSSPQHLSRQFKKITGITPTAYKKIGGRSKLDTI